MLHKAVDYSRGAFWWSIINIGRAIVNYFDIFSTKAYTDIRVDVALTGPDAARWSPPPRLSGAHSGTSG